MKWMEMVRLRSSDGGHSAALDAVTSQLEEIRSVLPATEVFLLQHALYEGDIAAVLVWNNEGLPAQTREGLLIAETLRRFGVVDHAVWRAAPGFEEDVTRNACKCAHGGGSAS